MKIKFEGLDCPNCAKTLESHINKLESVKSAKINFLKSCLEFDAENIDIALEDIIELTHKLEPDVKYIINKKETEINKSYLVSLALLFFGIGIGLSALFIKMSAWLFWLLFVTSAVFIGYKTYYKAMQLLIKGSINENLLVTISVIGAAFVGEYFDSLMVIALYSIGKILEGLAINKSKKSIEQLTNFKPEYAIVLVNGSEKKITPQDVKVGDILVVKPGEKVSVDGVVVEGEATLNVQSLTGESLPKQVVANSEILSGSIVLDGVLKIKATSLYKDSTVSKIINLIENASEKKSKTETIISKITKWYTLGVIVCALSVWGIIWVVTNNFNLAIYRGMIFLVVSCPCAFAISVPLTYFSGLGNASKKGILIKGSNYLDACAKLNIVAFDKTGTLTTGNFEVVKVESNKKGLLDKEVLYYAGLGEQYSLHPLAKSIVQANNKKLFNVEKVKEVSGKGVYYTFKENRYFVGRKSDYLKDTIVEVYEDDLKIGQIVLKDKIKETSKVACKELNKMNIKTVMLSGDNEEVVKNVAAEIGIDQVYAKLLPQDKFKYIENEKSKSDIKIGYVGDGLNDAPSLMIADVGISMGLQGSATSIEASDIVLATDNPAKVATAIKISKYTRKIVWENIVLSAIIKLVFLTLGTIGITGMLSAVIADVGVTILAILNSLRALNFKPKENVVNTSCCKNNKNRR